MKVKIKNLKTLIEVFSIPNCNMYSLQFAVLEEDVWNENILEKYASRELLLK